MPRPDSRCGSNSRTYLWSVEHRFALIGYPLEHTFSPAYFASKFQVEGIANCRYEILPVDDAIDLPRALRQDYQGFNVTVPHKSAVIGYLNAIDPAAHAIGAVNTIARIRPNVWKGFNTDAPAFADTLRAWYGKEPYPGQAIVLGTGGASRAVTFALRSLGIRPLVVSRSKANGMAYNELDDERVVARSLLVVNCTPVGTWPDTAAAPGFPYDFLTPRHRLYDLVYNPAETVFLQHGRRQGAQVKNGLEMLHRQADLAWSIWLSYDPDLSRSRTARHAT